MRNESWTRVRFPAAPPKGDWHGRGNDIPTSMWNTNSCLVDVICMLSNLFLMGLISFDRAKSNKVDSSGM